MVLIGITGGIGMGKSTAGRLLADLGVKVVDTDIIARELTVQGSTAFQTILHHFGSGILTRDGDLDRGSLAAIVFKDASARTRLEDILHPPIAEAWRCRVAEWRNRRERIAGVIIPLLFEKGYEGEFDAVVSLHCSPSTQRSRLRSRGWTDDQIDDRISAQMDPGLKVNRAHFVVWTEGNLSSQARQWHILRTELAGA